jgi:hypothetical protein
MRQSGPDGVKKKGIDNMSLYINTDEVVDVLLQDGWHHVEPHSFDIDSYEFHDRDYYPNGEKDPHILFAGGNGANWLEKRYRAGHERSEIEEICCPVYSILAVKVRRLSREDRIEILKGHEAHGTKQ